jgi:RNA-directed DNA polymerase
MAERPSSGNISTKLERIAKLAKQMPGVALTTLAHHIDLEWLNEAYRRTRKDGAVGVDGQTAAQYAENLDFVMVFEAEGDARRVQEVLPKRFGKYGLRLHPDKTRLLHFGPPTRPSAQPPSQSGRSFDLLGMTLYWNKSRRGRWVVTQKTAKMRFRRGLRRMSLWCHDHRHDSVEAQHRALNRKLLGHYSYYGITGNFRALSQFFEQAKRIWHKWLSRRNNRGITWERMNVILKAYPLPRPRVVHSVYRTAAKP